MTWVATIDLGGTRTKLGLVALADAAIAPADGPKSADGPRSADAPTSAARVHATRTIDSHAAAGLAGRLDAIAGEIRAMCRDAGAPSLAGVGLGVPCIVDPNGGGRIVSTPAGKFDDAPTLDLHAWSRDALGAPLRIENDAHAALLGEWTCGAGRGAGDLVHVTLGTGIGTSVLIGGRPLRGRHFQAGVLGGHLPAVPGGRPCACGGRGCFETECGSSTLPDRARADAGRFAASALSREPRVDYAAVFRLAAQGDALAVDLRERALGWWACVVASLINAYDPERVVVGGGVMRSADVILPRLRAAAAELAWTPWGRVDVRAGELGDDAALLGLAALVARPIEFL